MSLIYLLWSSYFEKLGYWHDLNKYPRETLKFYSNYKPNGLITFVNVERRRSSILTFRPE